MIAIVYVSLAINVVVAGFWGIVLGFFPQARFRNRPYGEDTPGTRILSSLYLAIMLFSLYALIAPDRLFSVCVFLFGFQIVYKLLSAITARDFRNPVVLSNLLIVLIHSISLCWLLKHGA
ncbi:MAG: hypothetical protein NTW91_08810 [Verrucomicrobia bacterium]|nr:hypothetical protein [Verrucomicrobiota bacterium]